MCEIYFRMFNGIINVHLCIIKAVKGKTLIRICSTPWGNFAIFSFQHIYGRSLTTPKGNVIFCIILIKIILRTMLFWHKVYQQREVFQYITVCNVTPWTRLIIFSGAVIKRDWCFLQSFLAKKCSGNYKCIAREMNGNATSFFHYNECQLIK